MHLPFIGRQQQLADIERLIKAQQGAIYAVTGNPGIGKSALLRQVESQYTDQSQIFIDLNDLPPLQTAVEFLRFFAEHTRGLNDTQTALAKINGAYNSIVDLTAPYRTALTEAELLAAEDLNKDGALSAKTSIFGKLSRALSGQKSNSDNAKPGDPEFDLLQALIQDCQQQQPLIFIDTYEFLEINPQQINSRYSTLHEQLISKQASIGLQDWLERFLSFLQQQGAIILIAGRNTGCWQAQTVSLAHYDETKILADVDWNDLGITLGRQGQLDAAIEAFQKQIEIEPDHDNAWFGLGVALGWQGRLDDAIAVLQKQIQIKPNHDKAWYNLGVALGRLGRYDDEIAVYQQQIQIQPNHDHAWYNLGIALARQGRLDAAIEAYRKQIQIKPDHDNAWNNLGIALNACGQLDAAIDAFRKQLAIKPDHDNAWNNLTIALKKQDQLDAKPGTASWSFISKA